ncbi:heavy-metal-associated domain-containing protein [Methylobacterium sp. sgz302541]|uniref:heavy-metal-associated domain-containing protein n=1 Tax=unclassified Methylobacterium TaxID=2615210 RepID=UPI003D33EDA6
MQFHIENMTCGGCARHVTQAIRTLDPNAQVEADTVTQKVTVDTTATREEVEKVLAADGYPAKAA